jgi:hypothetical protein
VPASAVHHGFLIDWLVPTLTQAAQTDEAQFLRNDIIPPTVEHN